jgi:hypothetical protein
MENLFIFIWNDVKNGSYGEGNCLIISTNPTSARLTLLENDYLSEHDKEKILNTEPEIHEIKFGFTHINRGSD